MDAYVIIGDANTRKSSILRSLTGCFNRSKRDILGPNGVMTIYARASSLQESKTEACDFIEEVLRAGQSSVVFCLWPHPNPLNPALYPNANLYIASFKKADWNIKAIAVLGGASFEPESCNVAYFPGAPNEPINSAAEAVRQHFCW